MTKSYPKQRIIWNTHQTICNYIIGSEENMKKNMLLHVCCAPCSSHVLEILENEYEITAFFYNPNITEEEEYYKRINELKRFVTEAVFAKDVNVCDGVCTAGIL